MNPAADTATQQAEDRVAARRKPSPGAAPRRRRSRRPVLSWQQLRDPRWHLPLLLALTTLALIFTWQLRRPFTLDVGGPDDAPFLRGVHGNESLATEPTSPPLTYRWTQATAVVTIPGYGATDAIFTLRLQGSRPNAAPPIITVAIGPSPAQTLTLAPDLRDYTFPVARDAFQDGALTVTITTPTFRPSGDARDLGIAVDSINLRDNSGASGLIAPPLALLGLTLLATLAVYALVALLLRSPTGAASAAAASALILIACAIGPRFTLALFAPSLAWIIGLVAATTALVGWSLQNLGERLDWATDRRALGGATLIAGANLFALLAGMRHPQFRSSDLMLNVHRLEFVQRGDWVFTLALPGARAIEAPYPPLFYAVMLPFAALIKNTALLVETTAALTLAASALLTFALARRVTGDDGASLWAAGIWSLLPIAYGMSSAGNFANLFGQGVANLALISLILTWGRWDRPPVTALLAALLTLALLGHFGVFLSLLVTVPLFVLVAAFIPQGRRQALALAIAFAVAVAVAWALYYRFHATLLLGHLQDFLGGDTNARGTSEAVSLAQRLRSLWGGLLLWWGWPALPLALAGINLLRRLRPSATLWLTLAWLGSALLFAAGELIAGLSVRFHLFVGPALAVVAAWAIWQLWRSHRHLGPLAALLIATIWLWQTFTYWTDRILHAYH